MGIARPQVKQATDQIVQAVAQAHKLQLIENPVDATGPIRRKTYASLLPGTAPRLSLTLSFGEHSLTVDIDEGSSRPTTSHRELARELKRRLEQAGLEVTKPGE